MMIERIRREHSYMVRMLVVLRQKLLALKEEKDVNYEVIREVVDYLSNHSERVHHPKEDILYRYYIEHYPDHETMENLEHEHTQLANKTSEFLITLEMILADAVVPHEVFVEQLEDFIRIQKQHLDVEEKNVLPKIQQTFTDKDWLEVENRWQENEDDPVFGDTIAEQYQQIATRVKQTAEECI